MDRLAGMEAFVAVVDAGGFQAAAHKLGIARALVGKRVALLERQLCVQLLNRTTRHVAVTGPGMEFYESCRRILQEFQRVSGELANLQQQAQGTLRVNAPMSFGQLQLAPALIEFQRLHPAVALHVTLTDRFVGVVEEGYDVVIRIGALVDSSLTVRQLCPVRRVLSASPAYLARAGTPACVRDLAGHRLLHYGLLATGVRWQLQGPDGETGIDVPEALCVNNAEVLKAAAIAGGGITLLPTFVCGPELRSGALARVLPDHEARPISLHALWPASRLQPARLRTFVDFLVERFHTDEPAWDRDGEAAAADLV